MRFDIVDLRLFVAVVDQGSLTKGAAAANLSLTSVSERVSGMEDMLGSKLLERHKRGVVVTEAGIVLLRHARIILEQFEQMNDDLRSYGTALKGCIKLWSNTAGLLAYLPRKLESFLQQKPDITIDLKERTSSEIVLAIAERRIDIGIVASSADAGALEVKFINDDRLVVVVNKSHRFCQRKNLLFSDVITEPFIGLSDGALETHLGLHAARLGERINYRIHLRQLDAIGRMVAMGIGVAIMPELSARSLNLKGLTMVPLIDAWATRKMYLCARDFKALSLTAKCLVDHLENKMGLPYGNMFSN